MLDGSSQGLDALGGGLGLRADPAFEKLLAAVQNGRELELEAYPRTP